jgi:CubicO group peptidase (beta-lactamase class C family)
MRVLILVLVAGAFVMVPAPAGAAPNPCAPVSPEFFDTTVPQRLAEDRVPGAVVSVTAGGVPVFAKGYGYADVERRIPFSASGSLVRIASVTKLFTWTAVMQQAQAGRLDLDTDVNRYLTTFQIPATYPEPVTLQTLMDHTAGFEDRVIGTAARRAGAVPALGAYLAANVPARIRPPGEVSAYSNYGAALAGYIVEQVSGEPYDAYLRRHVFDPLGMARSTAAEPVPAALAGDLARSYNTDETPPRTVPFQFDLMPPDGSISTTAGDMAKFMAAHLNGGGAILSPASTSLMHQRSFSADPRLDGYAHGIKERTINGHRVLMHDGSWEGFLSGMLLVPGCDLGLFVSTNGTGGADTLPKLVTAFFDRFAPAGVAHDGGTVSSVDGPTLPAGPRAGFYAPTRRNESTVERLLTLLGPARLRIGTDGIVHFRGRQWAPQDDGLYRERHGAERLSFRAGGDGRRYVVSDGPTYQLLGRTESPLVNLVLVLAFAVTALSALAVPVAGIRRGRAAPSKRWRRTRVLTATTALLGLGFLVGLGLALAGDTGDYIYGAPVSFQLLLTVPVLVLLATVVSVAGTVAGWRGSAASLTARVHQVVLLAGVVALAWFLWRWNLIGWWSVR